MGNLVLYRPYTLMKLSFEPKLNKSKNNDYYIAELACLKNEIAASFDEEGSMNTMSEKNNLGFNLLFPDLPTLK